MNDRREFLSHAARVAGLLATLGLVPGAVRAQASAAGWNAPAFEAKTMADLTKALGGPAPVESKEVSLTAPDIAENGAVVPIVVSTSLPDVRRLVVVVEKNPNLLSAIFEVSEALEPHFSTRVKMGQSSNVYAIAMTGDGKALYAVKEVKVTLGGCGG